MVLAALEDVNARFGTTVIVTTRNAEIRRMAHRVIRFQNGRVGEMTMNETRVSAGEIVW